MTYLWSSTRIKYMYWKANNEFLQNIGAFFFIFIADVYLVYLSVIL